MVYYRCSSSSCRHPEVLVVTGKGMRADDHRWRGGA
jgi:hypothetical protein